MATIRNGSVDGFLDLLITSLNRWGVLADEDSGALLDLTYKVRTVRAQEYIVRESYPAQYCSLLVSGFAIRHKIVGSGRRQIVSILLQGDLIDLHNSMFGTADHNVQMLTRGKIVTIPRGEIRKLMLKRPNIAKAILMQILLDSSILREWMAGIGRRDARTRIAHLLCEFAMRMKAAGLATGMECDLPMSQEQLADATGLTPVYVNRTLKQLGEERLIHRTSPRSITIADWQRLSEAGDFNSGYLHIPAGDPSG